MTSEVFPSTRLGALEKVQTNVRWEPPVDRRARDLVRIMNEGGERASKSELVAALVFHAPDDPERLSEMVRSYRVATVADAGVLGATVVDLAERRRPGPAPRHARGT